jgi:alpha-ketoglutarate-dependent 2,4-dichlorophenoxyacetate dioxygenase
MDRYAVLVYRGQSITDEQQMAFSVNFGPLEDARGGNITKPEANLGNMLWHSDSSFRAIPAKYSILSARVVNPVGGNTEYADMRAAYDALDGAVKAEIGSSTLISGAWATS